MTGAEGEGSSHSDRPRRAAPSRSSDALAPVPEDGNAGSADIATLGGVASSQPLGQSLRLLAAARSLPPQWVLNYQRTLGNQVTQRLLGERVARTPGQDGSLAPAAAGLQRKYLVPPYVEPSIDFNGLTYADLRAQIETYKSAPGARVNIKQQRLNKLIEIVNGFLTGRLSAPAVRNFEVLRQEILAEQALINNAGQPQPQPHQPTPTPTPIPTPTPTPRGPTSTVTIPTPIPTPTPTPRGPTSTVTTPSPIPTPTPTPQSGTPQVAQAQALSRPATPVQADPRLLAAEQAQAGVEQLIIAPRVSWTEVATGASYSSASARAGRRARTQIITSYHLAAGAGIKPLPLQYTLPGGAEIVNITAGTNHTVPSGGWTLNRSDVRTGGQPEVRASTVWYRVKVPAHLSEVSQTTVGVWNLAHDDVRASGREVRSNGTWYQLVTASQLTSEDTTYDVINLDGTDVRVVSKPENVSVGSVGFKQLPNELALFPSAPSGADIKQLGLGDCYLQALLINIAEQNPGHLTDMLRDNGDGTVTVRFYTVDETTPTAPAYAPEDIRINKSLPQTATGQALYQGGAPWARILQKAFAAFAQRHGQYGGAYDHVKGAGYAQIASGMTYKLYGVFYGPARVAAGFERTSYDPNQSNATNLQANAEVIKKLLQFAGQDRTLAGAGQIMSLTVGATLKAHVQRAAGVIGRIDETRVPRDQLTTWQRMVYNLPIVVQNLNDPRNARVDATRVNGMSTLVRDADQLAVGLRTWATQNQSDSDIAAVFELLNDIKEAGTDASEGQRFSYSGHAYSIVRATFRPTTPDPANLTPTVLGAINMETTQIKLRNPHGTNSPNAYGAPQNDTGEFDLTLAQFLRNFSEVEYGLVRATR